MSIPEEVVTGSKGRSRGGPLRISRAKILEAARNFDPQTMTMQAVADELGVDRKALNYHVTDRKGLMQLIAADVFESSFTTAFHNSLAAAPPAEEWVQALTAWSYAVRDGMVATGVLTNYFRIGTEELTVFEPAELVLRRLIDAGFDRVVASRALVLATRFAMGVGRDVVMEAQLGEHPQDSEVRRVLDVKADGDSLEALRDMVALGINGPGDIQSQFEFELDLFITGMKAHLPVS